MSGPFVGHGAIDGQSALAKGLIDGYEPLFERVGFAASFGRIFSIHRGSHQLPARLDIGSRPQFLHIILRRSERVGDPFGFRK
jgi:hypothetical protein